MSTAVATDPRVPGHSIVQWANDLLTKMFGNTLPANVRAADVSGLVTWANTESGGYNPKASGGRFNPLNTTEGAKGFAGQGGTQGNIKDFASYEQGLEAQAYNLEHTTNAGYGQILDALRAGDTNALFSAVNSSAFGTHGLGKGGTPTAPTGSGSSNAATLTGFDLNPLNWWGDLVGGVKGDVAKVGVTLAVLVAGLSLIVLGAWRSVSPNVRQSITSAATVAAVA